MTAEQVTSLETTYPSSPAASLWLGDLRWHQRSFRESRFRWSGRDALNIVTWHTGGQTEFTSVQDLEALQRYQYAVMDQAGRVSNAMAERLRLAKAEMAGEWGSAAEALGLSDLECEAAIWFAANAGSDDQDSVNVRRVLEFVPFRNPLIEAWELKQLMRMYEGAADMLEDAICDLLHELRPDRPPGVLAQASDTHGLDGLAQRVATAQAERGGVGDVRRIPKQVF